MRQTGQFTAILAACVVVGGLCWSEDRAVPLAVSTPPSPPQPPSPANAIPAVGSPEPDYPPDHPPRVEKASPLRVPPLGARVVYTKTKKVLIDYEVVRQDARGVRRVNLWLAGEQGWAIAATAKPGEPLEVELVGDGAYGTKVIPVAGDGNAQNPPTRDTHPDSWIVLDTQRPVVEFKVSIATSPDGRPPAPFVVEASVRDENIDPSSINFRGSYESGPMKSRWVSLFTGADLGKGTIETPFGVFVSRQPKAWGDPHTRTFAFDWTPSVACGPTTSLWVSVKDQAGNEVGGLGQIVHTALPPAAARVTGLRPVPAQ